MNIKKVHLADLEMVYAVAAMNVDGDTYCLAASENRNGSCLLIHPETGKIHTVWNNPGGVMTLLPLKSEQAFLSIDEFYPVFDSAAASIWKTELAFSENELKVKKEKLCDLPYAHRITMLESDGEQYLVGASLCSKKDFVEDWSKPGGIYVGKYEKGKPVLLMQVYLGLTKNHGMFLNEKADGSQELLIGASEGILSVSKEDAWKTKLMSAGETSDIWTEDFDGDGQKEFAVIQGFHGEHIRILKMMEEQFRCIGEVPVHFGHVLWAGRIFGSLYLIGGSRGERKELMLYKIIEGDTISFDPIILDEETGATQISVTSLGEKMVIFAANHGSGSVDMYVLSK